MLQIRRILCPVDLSDYSRHALDHAIALARWYQAKITVLHVFAPVPAPAPLPGAPGFVAVLPPPGDPEALLGDVARFVNQDASRDVSIEIVTREGDPVRCILAEAEDDEPDLLVLATHGRSGFDRFVLGSVTEKVLRRVYCPVLSVPPRAPHVAPSAPVTYTRILCPTDFSASATHALKHALALAQEADAHLTVLHVTDGTATTPECSLDDAVPAGAETYCTIETLSATGRPYREIVRVAAERKIDLIVMGVRRRGAVDMMLFGSTAQHVVRLAHCPVLTLRGL
jgi:nucleotide-binding universal stress UspA family protein